MEIQKKSFLSSGIYRQAPNYEPKRNWARWKEHHIMGTVPARQGQKYEKIFLESYS